MRKFSLGLSVRLFTIAALLVGACAGAPGRPSGVGPGGSATSSAPICGVLTAFPTEAAPEQLRFLRPGSPAAPAVERYLVVDRRQAIAPLAAYANWWICITDGRITAPPDPAQQAIGEIEIVAFSIDQSNAERGQE